MNLGPQLISIIRVAIYYSKFHHGRFKKKIKVGKNFDAAGMGKTGGVAFPFSFVPVGFLRLILILFSPEGVCA